MAGLVGRARHRKGRSGKIRQHAPILRSIKRAHIDSVLLAGFSNHKVKEMTAVRQKYGKLIVTFRPAHILRNASGGGDLLNRDPAAVRGRKDDHTLVIPRSTGTSIRHIAY